VGSTNTGFTVLNGLVTESKLAQVVADHFRLNFDVGETLAVVNTNNGADHLRDDDSITQVSLDSLRLVTDGGLTLRLSELLNQALLILVQTSVELSASTSVEKLTQLLGAKLQQVVQINSSVRELSEDSLLISLINNIIINFRSSIIIIFCESIK
jgi:hypothetical protein